MLNIMFDMVSNGLFLIKYKYVMDFFFLEFINNFVKRII